MSKAADQDPRPGIRRFEKLPGKVKFVRSLGGKDDACIVECGHPDDFRFVLEAGPRRGREMCGICKGEDLLRTCLTIAKVPESARSAAAQSELKPQASLF